MLTVSSYILKDKVGMDKLNTIWFLQKPLDPEHKNYILLDYLKNKSQILDGPSILEGLKEISKIVRVIGDFKKDRKLQNKDREDLSNKEKKELAYAEKLAPESEEYKAITEIIDSTLDTLYGFSEVCMEIVENEREKIKIFKISSKFSQKTEEEKNSGVLIVRNMISDKIFSYYWKESIMTTEGKRKDVVILKRINIKNSDYSISYEHIYHEVINQISEDKNFSPEFFVMEIYEDFNERSGIFKMAKERFIQSLSQYKNY